MNRRLQRRNFRPNRTVGYSKAIPNAAMNLEVLGPNSHRAEEEKRNDVSHGAELLGSL
jgi:hypothetical protein